MRRPRSPASPCRWTAAGPRIERAVRARRVTRGRMSMTNVSEIAGRRTAEPTDHSLSGKQQVVLVFQGGGALGAYQAGVYQALHEAGIEPDWIIGTSIGAINATLIAGNQDDVRLARLEEFWETVEHNPLLKIAGAWPIVGD